jgi:hypothetical protein
MQVENWDSWVRPLSSMVKVSKLGFLGSAIRTITRMKISINDIANVWLKIMVYQKYTSLFKV